MIETHHIITAHILASMGKSRILVVGDDNLAERLSTAWHALEPKQEPQIESLPDHIDIDNTNIYELSKGYDAIYIDRHDANGHMAINPSTLCQCSHYFNTAMLAVDLRDPTNSPYRTFMEIKSWEISENAKKMQTLCKQKGITDYQSTATSHVVMLFGSENCDELTATPPRLITNKTLTYKEHQHVAMAKEIVGSRTDKTPRRRWTPNDIPEELKKRRRGGWR